MCHALEDLAPSASSNVLTTLRTAGELAFRTKRFRSCGCRGRDHIKEKLALCKSFGSSACEPFQLSAFHLLGVFPQHVLARKFWGCATRTTRFLICSLEYGRRS